MTIGTSLKFLTWLRAIDIELKAREACVLPSRSATEGKNDFGFSSPSHTPYTGSSLVSGSSSVYREKKKFKKGSGKGHSSECSGRKCVFCDGDHWLDKCRVISNGKARKDLLKKGNRFFMYLKTDHISRNCQKTKLCFYCKKLHNSAIYSERTSSENIKVSTNYASNI